MRIALVGTFPPLRSGITDYTIELGRALASGGDEVELYGGEQADPREVGGLGEIHDVGRLVRGEDAADVVLCQVGCHPAHAYVRPLLATGRPIVVDQHDWSLYDLTASCFIGRPLPFLRELVANEGFGALPRAMATDTPPGEPWGPRARLAYALTRHPDRRERFPLNRWVLDRAAGLIVHNPYLERRVRERSATPVWTIPHGVRDDLPRPERAEARRALGFAARGIPDEGFVVLSFGLIQQHKRIPVVLETFARLAADEPGARYVLLGPRCPEYDLDADLARLGLVGRVIVEDSFPPIEQVATWMRAADVGVNLRGPAYGGMSGALLKMMVAGLPVVASPVPELVHLDPAVVPFVAPGPGEVDALEDLLRGLVADPGARAARGEAGRRFVLQQGYRWRDAARAYRERLGGLIR